MATTLSLKANSRSNIGRNAVKKTRHSGNVPGVLYGHGENTPLEIEGSKLLEVLNHRGNADYALVELDVTGDKSGKHTALLQEVQIDPLSDRVLHADFQKIKDDELIRVQVPLVETGDPIGVKKGGALNHVLRTLKIECLPKDLPTQIVVDISSMELGEIKHVGEIPVPEGINVLNPSDVSVFIIELTRAAVAARAASGAPES